MKRNGFTLIEVMVALTIGAAVVLMVNVTFSSLVGAAGRLEEQRAELRQEYLSRERLTAVFANLDVRTAGFGGGPDRIRFATLTSDGAESAELSVADGRIVLLRGGRPDTLMPALAMRADYLLAAGADTRWLMQWSSPASAPVLIRLRLTRDSLRTDTLLLAIGSRG